MLNLLHVIASTCTGSQYSLHVDGRGTCYNTGIPTVQSGSHELQFILQLFFAILAAISVLFVVIGGMRYTISGGDPEDMSKAKNTIIYALVGLVVALFAEAIVSFALGYIQGL